MFRYRLLLLALCATVLVSSCGEQGSGGPTDLLPIACHRELGVGMLFVTVENYGYDAGPSMMTVVFETHSAGRPQVQLTVQTPDMPSGAERLIVVDLPTVAGTGGFLLPVRKITITVDARNTLPEANRANNILVTDCNDLT